MLLVSSAAATADFKAGQAAYGRGDFTTAYEEWLPPAEQGNPMAQYMLGTMYDGGEGVPKNDAEAEKWYRKAAKQGDGLAELRLYYLFAESRIQPANNEERVRWRRKLADDPFEQIRRGLESARNQAGLFRYLDAQTDCQLGGDAERDPPGSGGVSVETCCVTEAQ